MPSDSVLIAKPAATVVLLREAPADTPFEVYLTKRPDHFAFVGGFHVFPGGAMDDADRSARARARLYGLTDDDAHQQLAGAPDAATALAHWVTAAREVLEEAGVLLATDARERDATGACVARALRAMPRTQEDGGADAFVTHLEEADLRIPCPRIRYFSHWTTPPGPSRRFDTRFFVARLPADQEASPHPAEVSEALWLSPGEALERWEAGALSLIPPSVFTLQQLAPFRSIDALFDCADLATEAESRGNARLSSSW